MAASKSLPARPSLESLRKQAKKLVRDTAAGDAGAIARARAHVPNATIPLTQRSAQLVIARQYGYSGWQDLIAEVSKRLGNGLEWAVTQARRAIHDNEVDRLRQLLAEYPALLSWRGDEKEPSVLEMATGSYGDSFDPERERNFTRGACAELLIDAGAVVMPAVCEGILESRARGLLHLFHRKGLLPSTLEYHAALGDLEAVRSSLGEHAGDVAAVTKAFVRACAFHHRDLAALLLDRLIALDPELGRHIDRSVGRTAFVAYFIEKSPQHAKAVEPWKAFVMEHVRRAVVDGDLAAFIDGLQRDPWLLDEPLVEFQNDLIGVAALNDRAEMLAALLDMRPAILRRQPPPPSQAIEFALTYGNARLLPLLVRIWPLPDDLPHAAGTGNLERVRHWFTASGEPALGDPDRHYPYNDARARADLHWTPPSEQQILDTAFAFAVINRHFDVADFLLEHGADIDTDWNSHEPASILHHLVFEDDYDAMRYLIDRGIDLTIKDYRWNSTARGWALYGKNDYRMAQWLEEAERQRAAGVPAP